MVLCFLNLLGFSLGVCSLIYLRLPGKTMTRPLSSSVGRLAVPVDASGWKEELSPLPSAPRPWTLPVNRISEVIWSKVPLKVRVTLIEALSERLSLCLNTSSDKELTTWCNSLFLGWTAQITRNFFFYGDFGFSSGVLEL